MSEFLAMQSGPTTNVPKGLMIDGSFGCQTCYVQCDQAEYFAQERILLWTCPEDHKSYIEDFIL